MKWILAAMVYVAVAAAAFSQESWIYADLLWGVTFLVTCYALLLAGVSTSQGRAMAGGFALFAAGFALCAGFAQEATPTSRFLEAAGVSQNWTPIPMSPSQAYPVPSPPPPIATPTPSASVVVPSTPFAQPATPSTISGYAVFPTPVIMTPSLFSQKLRAANAVAAMACGLLGGALATRAYRRYRIESAVV